jgi:ubiquinone/menaquinone biosynthesis C-methylase UbiE
MAAEVQHSSQDHKAIVREEFTRQADAYAAAAVITSEARLERLIAAIRPDREARALEVATGPGYVAMALAKHCREVLGIDLTEAPLRIAERTRAARGLNNVRFEQGDAETLPDSQFDIVTCRFAFHHFEDAERVLGGMQRVCREGGTIAVEDLYASEVPARAAYWNAIERLRDHSHTRALALSELIAMFARAGIDVERLYSDEITSEVEPWLASSQTGAADAQEVRARLTRDMNEDLSGIRPSVRDGKLCFIQRTVALIGRKLPR